MGFFSNLKDALSGKTYKHNTLIGSNVLRLIKKVESEEDFVKRYIYQCVASIDALLSLLLFEELKTKDDKEGVDFNTFKKNIEKLDEQKVFEIFKLLGGHYLMVFLKNKSNLAFLKSIKLDRRNFEKEIIAIFEYSNEDVESYKKLSKKFTTNSASYFLNLYKEIFSKGFGLPSDNNLPAMLVFSKLLSNSYIQFMDMLQYELLKRSS